MEATKFVKEINTKRDFDCDTCGWYKNDRCTHTNKNAYYPCPDWLRRCDPIYYDLMSYRGIENLYDNDPKKWVCDKEWKNIL